MICVANLAPRQMTFGVSEGMVVAAGAGGQEILSARARLRSSARAARALKKGTWSARGIACEFKKFVAARWLLAEAVLDLSLAHLVFAPGKAPASGSLGQGRTFPRGA